MAYVTAAVGGKPLAVKIKADPTNPNAHSGIKIRVPSMTPSRKQPKPLDIWSRRCRIRKCLLSSSWGCQGEVGVSSAICAAGMVSLFSDDPAQIVHGMALSLKNLLGLVCDPIAGPIEVSCIITSYK